MALIWEAPVQVRCSSWHSSASSVHGCMKGWLICFYVSRCDRGGDLRGPGRSGRDGEIPLQAERDLSDSGAQRSQTRGQPRDALHQWPQLAEYNQRHPKRVLHMMRSPPSRPPKHWTNPAERRTEMPRRHINIHWALIRRKNPLETVNGRWWRHEEEAPFCFFVHRLKSPNWLQ